MQGLKRRVIYVSTYEIIGLGISSLGLALLSGTQLTHTGPLAFLITTIAVSWNFIYNLIFEAWEKRQTLRQRTV
ncbi:chlorhexidine efflux transporter, partial [Acinetobacter guillouiae]